MNKQTLTIISPTDMDGNPYEVAGRSIRQAQGLLEYAEEALLAAQPMVRNAWMTRNLTESDQAGTQDTWEADPLQGRLEALQHEISVLSKALGYVAAHAEYDPKNPPKA